MARALLLAYGLVAYAVGVVAFACLVGFVGNFGVRGIDEGPQLGVVDQPFIARGNVATAGGCLAAPYLVAWLIARLKGLEAAREVLHYFAPVGEKQAYVERALAHVAPALGAGAALAAVAA